MLQSIQPPSLFSQPLFSHTRLLRIFVTSLVLAFLLILLHLSQTAHPVFAQALHCTTDSAGANDLPGQKDLTQYCYSTFGNPLTNSVQWSWDEINWSGGNTGNACSLYDSDGDGNANYAVCAIVSGQPATQSANSPQIYQCTTDSRPDRCVGDTLINGPYTGSCTVSQQNNDPFLAGDVYPKDTVASCTIQLSEVGGASATLLDACSYPSEQPNSAPSDCVGYVDNSGRLEVSKLLVPATDIGKFNLLIDGNAKASDVGNGGTTGKVIVSAGNHTVGESASTGSNLANYASSISCKDAGGTGNLVASATGSGPLFVNVPDGGNILCVISNTAQNASIRLRKEGTLDLGADGIATPGDLIDYTLVSTNDGNTTLTNVTISDPKVNGLICSPLAPATLAPGSSMTCTGNYAITQADIDAGKVDNTATVKSNQTAEASASNSEVVPQSPSLGIDKEGTLNLGSDGIATPGDLINYTLTARNSGNQTLNNVTISDPKLATLTCTPTQPTTLAPGAAMVCTGSYAITQADITVGVVTNKAIADSSQTPPTEISNLEDIPQAPALEITKDGVLALGADETATPGDGIDYTLTARNSGNISLSNVTVSDPKLGALTCTPNLPTTLAPGASVVCTGSYAITQVDIDAGVVHNTARADSDQTPPVTVPNQENISQTPTLAINKSGSLDVGTNGLATVGDTIYYTLTARNDGNQTLTGVTIADSKLGTLNCSDPLPTTLAAGSTVVCTGSYPLTQADIDSGTVVNTAIAQSNQTPSVSANHTQEIPQAPSLGIDKRGDLNLGSDGIATVGDTIRYTITARNSGNTTLSTVTISDPKLALLTCLPALPTSLAPGASVVCSGSYAITQADIDAGIVNNTASTDSDQTPTESVPHQEDVPQAPGLNVDKTGTLDMGVVAPADVVNLGDSIHYTITARNSGNQTLSNVTISDAKLPSLTCTPTQPATLAPGATIRCTGSYLITQADIENGIVNNVATADSDQTAPTPGSKQQSIPQTPSLEMVKRGTLLLGADQVANPGDTILYTLTARNTGNTILTNVTISDPKLATMTCTPTMPTALSPVNGGNAALICTGSYTLTQADIDTGSVINLATATGQPPMGGPLRATGSTYLNVDAASQISAEKSDKLTLDANGDGAANPGDQIEYTILVHNTGNTAGLATVLNDLLDSNMTLVVGSVTTSQGNVSKGNQPGDSVVLVDMGAIASQSTATVRFIVRVNNPLSDGVTRVANQAVVSGSNFPTTLTDDPDTPTLDDPTQTPVIARPELSAGKNVVLVEDRDGNGFASPGDVLEYRIAIVNNGTQAASGVIFNDTPDPNTTLIIGSVQSSAGSVIKGNSGSDGIVEVNLGTIPGQGGNELITFRIAINNPLRATVATIQNQGSVSSQGQPTIPTDDPLTSAESDPTDTPVNAAPHIDASKRVSLLVDADGNKQPSPGDTLIYQVTIVNSGNQDATALYFDDTIDANTTLIPGSVQISAGTIIQGNAAGDTHITIAIGTLAGQGGTVTISYQIKIKKPLPPTVQTIQNQGVVSGDGLPNIFTDDPTTPKAPDITEISVVAQPLLKMSKTDQLVIDADTIAGPSAGDTLLYRITIVNEGNTSALNVIVNDTPDADTRLVVGSVQSDRGAILLGNSAGDTSVRVSLGTLPAGERATITFRVQIKDVSTSLTLHNQATATSDNLGGAASGGINSDDPDTASADDATATPVIRQPTWIEGGDEPERVQMTNQIFLPVMNR